MPDMHILTPGAGPRSPSPWKAVPNAVTDTKTSSNTDAGRIETPSPRKIEMEFTQPPGQMAVTQ